MSRRNWRQRKEDEQVSSSVIHGKSTSDLKEAQKFIMDLLEFRKTKKLESTYIGGMERSVEYNGENKIYCTYNFDGTVTGRLSCSKYSAGNKKPKGVSFHTLPREEGEYNIRSMVVAPPGYAFVTVDYSAMELRVLSHVAKEKKMQKAFIENDDLHWYTAELIHGKSRKDLSRLERQEAKATSFLIVYGGTEATLAPNIGKTVEQARAVMDSWFEVYDSIQPYMDFIYENIRDNKYAYSLFGRRRHLQNVDSRNPKVAKKALRQGLNFTIQSVASDILLCSLLGIGREFRHRGMKSRICQTVHDSGEFLVELEELDEALKIIDYYMVQNPIMTNRFGIKLDVPLSIEMLVGSSFGDGIEAFLENGVITNRDEVTQYLDSINV
jgi:DNA polymerase-1